MRPFDRLFSARVKEVFDDYTADHLASQGWSALEQGLPRPSRRRAYLPVWARAASVALLLASGGYLGYRLAWEGPEGVPPHPSHAPGLRVDAAPAGGEGAPPALGAQRPALAPAAGLRVIPAPLAAGSPVPGGELAAAPIGTPANGYPQRVDGHAPGGVSASGLPDTARSVTHAALAIQEPSASAMGYAHLDAPQGAPLSALAPPWSRATSLGVSAAGVMARVGDRHADEPGVVLGVFAEHRLSTSVSLRSGLALARHSFTLHDASVVPSPTRMDGFLAHHAAPQASHFMSSQAHIDLLALEIPLAISLNIHQSKRQRVFITAGASTLLYLRQRFSDTYSISGWGFYAGDQAGVPVLSAQADQAERKTAQNSQLYTVQDERGAFHHADPFGLATFSVGYAFPFGGSSLEVEPFVHLPMGGVTSHGLQIWLGGVTVRYRLWAH